MLSGYPIKMCGVHIPILNPYDEKEKGPFKFLSLMGKVVEIIWTKMNCSVTQDMISDFGFISTDGTPVKTFEDLFRGKYDVHENIFYETGIWQNQLNLLDTTGICCVCQEKKISPLVFKFCKCLHLVLDSNNGIFYLYGNYFFLFTAAGYI